MRVVGYAWSDLDSGGTLMKIRFQSVMNPGQAGGKREADIPADRRGSEQDDLDRSEARDLAT